MTRLALEAPRAGAKTATYLLRWVVKILVPPGHKGEPRRSGPCLAVGHPQRLPARLSGAVHQN
jgi:hypothetical protein